MLTWSHASVIYSASPTLHAQFVARTSDVPAAVVVRFTLMILTTASYERCVSTPTPDLDSKTTQESAVVYPITAMTDCQTSANNVHAQSNVTAS